MGMHACTERALGAVNARSKNKNKNKKRNRIDK